MKRVITMAIAVVLGAGAANALDLEGISAKDVAGMTQEAKINVPEPSKGIAPENTARAATPIASPVNFKSPAFAELLINSLKVKPELVMMGGGQSQIYKVGGGLICYKSFATDIHLPNEPRKANYACAINPAGGWKAMGMEGYGSGSNREFSLALYAALKVKEVKEEGMATKTLELDLADPAGGTERNLLSCVKPSAEIEAMGFRPVCQFLNGL